MRSTLKFFLHSAPSVKRINAILRVKAGDQLLLKVFLRLFPAIGAVISPISVKSTLIVLRQIIYLRQKCGKVGLVKYLKVCSVCLQQCIGGHVLTDVGLLGMRISRTNTGIPRIIPPYHRELIRQGNPVIIRLYLTIFALYRVILIPAKVKIKSITDPFSGENANLIDGHIDQFNKLFVQPAFSKVSFKDYLESKACIFPIWKSSAGSSSSLGPNPYSTHPLTLVLTGMAISADESLGKSLSFILQYTNNTKAIKLLGLCAKCVGIMNFALAKVVYGNDSLLSEGVYIPKDIYQDKGVLYKPIYPPKYLGKLALKHEPAGKMRVFAMVDPFTQWALYPLHKVLLHIIRRYKMDGTFNQVKPLSHMINSAALYSLDLSSATDRLPISLQVKLLAAITGSPEFASEWSNLLVGRSYSVPRDAGLPLKEVLYSVGQPMGALSSWAMLALTHHFIVQAAAWNAGFPRTKLYKNYALLGDDLVLGDRAVMLQYLHILRGLGVECGLHKSVISHSGESLEFAKRTFFRGQDVSPVSLTEFIAANGSISEMISFGRKYHLGLVKMAHTLGFGWRVKSSINKPVGKLNAVLRGISVALIIPDSKEQVMALFSLGHKLLPDTSKVLIDFIRIEYSLLEKQLHRFWKLTELRKTGGHLVLDFADQHAVPSSLEDGKINPFREALKEAWYCLYKPVAYKCHASTLQWQSRLKLRRYVDLGNAYLEYLTISKNIALIPYDFLTLTMKRVDNVRGKSPLQLKLWNRWSSIFQGTKVDDKNLLQLPGPKFEMSISDTGQVPQRLSKAIRKSNIDRLQLKS